MAKRPKLKPKARKGAKRGPKEERLKIIGDIDAAFKRLIASKKPSKG